MHKKGRTKLGNLSNHGMLEVSKSFTKDQAKIVRLVLPRDVKYLHRFASFCCHSCWFIDFWFQVL